MRERSNREGVPMEELKSETEEPEPAKKTTKLKGKKPKKQKGGEIVIKMKDKDGNVVEFDEDLPPLEEQAKSDKPAKNGEKPKKRTKPRLESENVLAALSSSRTKAIESEDTLKMIMMAVKSETAQGS
jgi:hypothetical protein